MLLSLAAVMRRACGHGGPGAGHPCIVLEQNAVPGVTNRILGKFARRIIAALPVKGFAPDKVRFGQSGPRRFTSSSKNWLRPNETPQILLFGDPRVRVLNEAMMELAPILEEREVDVRIVHQTGRIGLRTRQSPLRVLGHSTY